MPMIESALHNRPMSDEGDPRGSNVLSPHTNAQRHSIADYILVSVKCSDKFVIETRIPGNQLGGIVPGIKKKVNKTAKMISSEKIRDAFRLPKLKVRLLL